MLPKDSGEGWEAAVGRVAMVTWPVTWGLLSWLLIARVIEKHSSQTNSNCIGYDSMSVNNHSGERFFPFINHHESAY